MRRIMSLATVAVLMAVMSVASAPAAFVEAKCRYKGADYACSGGSSGGLGGGGGVGRHVSYDSAENVTTSSGGFGSSYEEGDGGAHCTTDLTTDVTECSGKGY
jgi:hypothetical protein